MPKTKANCNGCYYDFYNHSEEEGCWNFKTAKLMIRKKIGINDWPPWNWRPKKYLSCYTQTGYIFLNGDRKTW